MSSRTSCVGPDDLKPLPKLDEVQRADCRLRIDRGLEKAASSYKECSGTGKGPFLVADDVFYFSFEKWSSNFEDCWRPAFLEGEEGSVSTYLTIPVTSTTRRNSGSSTSYGQQVERHLMLTSPELDIRSFVREEATQIIDFSPSVCTLETKEDFLVRFLFSMLSSDVPDCHDILLTFDLYQLQSTIKELVQEEFDLYQLQSTIKEMIIETIKSKVEIPAIAAAAVKVSKSFLEMLLPAALLELELDDGGVVPLPVSDAFWGSDLESRGRKLANEIVYVTEIALKISIFKLPLLVTNRLDILNYRTPLTKLELLELFREFPNCAHQFETIIPQNYVFTDTQSKGSFRCRLEQ
ncbi:hypothetical protein SELMODRAFT_403391 [Selaginella moellendorffii]|uniref:Uncharacterized protein n=1 Tax=Selaginella moellendorffii TaxID=88036 RepID=D8QR92_SELML|nr:hypothetical protein SELMODRAFT_403391 [Selaginella moellendorffii]